MSTVLTSSTRVAHKPHHCYYCGESIAIGDKHEYRTGVNYGDFWTMRAHPECDAWANEHWDSGDYECHSQVDMRRPMTAFDPVI